MPRRKAIDIGDTAERMRRTWEQTRDVKATARACALSTKTVRKYLKAFGYELRPGRKPGVVYPKAKRSPVHEYLLKTNEPLPKSTVVAARKMGVTKDTLKSYLRRRREKYRTFLESVQPLGDYGFIVTDQRGRRLPLKAIRGISIEEVLANGRAVISGHLPTGNYVEARFRVAALAVYLRDLRDPQEPPEPPGPTDSPESIPPGTTEPTSGSSSSP